MVKNRIKVDSKNSDGETVVIYATRPTQEDNANAQIESNKMFQMAVMGGALVRKKLEEQIDIWGDKKQAKLDKYNKDIVSYLTALKKGGIKLQEARDLAIKVRIARMNTMALQSERNEYDSYTAEAQAENAKIDYLIANCLKNEKGENYFETIEEYRESGSQPFVIEAAGKLVNMIYGVEDNWEADLPENKFLMKYNFVNDDLRLVNKDGEYVSVDNSRINENFQYVNNDGKIVDEDGNIIDEDGLPEVDVEPFLDDDGKPIEEVVVDKNKTVRLKKKA